MQVNQHPHPLFHKNVKKVDFLFVETNDLEGLLEDVCHLELSETQIMRAWLECNKLRIFYNHRRTEKNKEAEEPKSYEKRSSRSGKWDVGELDEKINTFAYRRL